MNGNASLELLQEQHSMLSSKLVDLMAACKTSEQRRELRKAMLLASENLAEARLRVFDENESAVSGLITQLKNVESQLRSSLNAFHEVEQVLGVVTAAVSLGQSLVALGQEENE